MPPKALSNSQEIRIIAYLDDEFLKLSRKFENRRISKDLRDLRSYFDQLVQLQGVTLSIPAAPPSSALRVAYYLQLTGLIPDAVTGYPLNNPDLPFLFERLDCFDRGWQAIFSGLEWDITLESGRPGESGDSGIRQTDLIRLSGIIDNIRSSLSVMLGLITDHRIKPGTQQIQIPELVSPEPASPEASTVAMDTDSPYESDTFTDTARTYDTDATIIISDSDDDEDDDEEGFDEFDEVDVDHPSFDISYHAEPSQTPELQIQPEPSPAPSDRIALEDADSDDSDDLSSDAKLRLKIDAIFPLTREYIAKNL